MTRISIHVFDHCKCHFSALLHASSDKSNHFAMYTRVTNSLIPLLPLLSSLICCLPPIIYAARHRFYSSTPIDDSVPSSFASNAATTDIHPEDLLFNRWSIFNLTRVLGSTIQLFMSAAVLIEIHRYHVDTVVEGTIDNVIIASSTSCIFWVSRVR